MRSFRHLRMAVVLVFAISAVVSAQASAAPTFTYSATGELTGHALNTQEFTVSAGTIKCLSASSSGKIESTNFAEQHLTVAYSSCSAFGFTPEVSGGTYLFKANGEVQFASALKFNVPAIGCSITFTTQTAKAVAYDNNSGKLIQTSNLSGLKYTSSGGFCGASGENGTFKGNNEIERVGGGTVAFDP